MLITAYRKFGKEKVKIKPVFFCWYVGLQFKIKTGPMAASIFCTKEDGFIFPWYSKIVLSLVKAWYFIEKYLWFMIKRRIPSKIRQYLRKLLNIESELPF